MDMDLFTKIVDEAVTIPVIKVYSLQGLGEPTLDRDLPERVAYIKGKDSKTTVEVFTNGFHLNPEVFDALRDAGLGHLTVSLNAVNQEQHEKIMGVKGKFQRVCDNLDYILKNQGSCGVGVHAVLDGVDFSLEHGMEFLERWGDFRSDGVGKVVVQGNWAGEQDMLFEEQRPFKPNECCDRALTTIYVMYDGQVTPCCFMPTDAVVFGDLRKQTLREVYASERYVQFREDHSKDEADKYSFCKSCSRI